MRLYGEGEIKTDDGRFATTLGWKNTQLYRDPKSIIIPGTLNDNEKHNMGVKVVDPIGFASRTPAPTLNYSILGKIPELRPMNNNGFNEELFNEMMGTQVSVSDILGYAVEVSVNETAIMPVVSLTGGENIIGRFSQKLVDGSIPTAKYSIINNTN